MSARRVSPRLAFSTSWRSVARCFALPIKPGLVIGGIGGSSITCFPWLCSVEEGHFYHSFPVILTDILYLSKKSRPYITELEIGMRGLLFLRKNSRLLLLRAVLQRFGGSRRDFFGGCFRCGGDAGSSLGKHCANGEANTFASGNGDL